MGEESKCLLYMKPKSLMGKRIGHCDVDSSSATCEGDVNFCERPESLRQYFRRIVEEGGERNH
jgi:hypothetical protein